jgi:cysteine desulfurase
LSLDNYYLDYNATSPLVKPVIDRLAKGDLLFANPASVHSLGKKSRKSINENNEFILRSFSLENDFDIIYHSGATVWINTVFNLTRDDLMIYFSSDHSAVCSVANKLKSMGGKTLELKVNKMGYFDLEKTIRKINSIKVNGTKWINYTFVHNETGLVWDLERADKLKVACDLNVHVDAVQSIAKIQNFQSLNMNLDCYTFSSHKFGGPKSFGFSLIKKNTTVFPLILGGGQQSKLRSGTENPLAIDLTAIALKYNLDNFRYEKSIKFRKSLEDLFEQSDYFKVVAKDEKRASNTIGLICSVDKSDIMLTRFDMHGLFISAGSACSSGSIEPPQVIMDMGYKDAAKSFLRISFSPLLNFDQSKLLSSVTKFINSL